jgi:tRNA dimethylallyltransferase
MFESGLLREVRALLDAGFSPTLQPLQTIGYRECIEHLSGDLTLDHTVELVKRNTRRYAKRQLTWLRRYPDAHWLDLTDQ